MVQNNSRMPGKHRVPDSKITFHVLLLLIIFNVLSVIVNRMCETYDTMNKENSVYSLRVIVQSIAIEFDKNKI